jgi:nicotinamide mononucleotide transporter
LTIQQILHDFLQGIADTTWLEYIAVVSGIVSVWFSRKENILVYPTGLVNTIVYVYLSFKYHLLGEASVNFYYTVMSIYGWWLWTKKNQRQQNLVVIKFSDTRWWLLQLSFFAVFYIVIFVSLTYLKQIFASGAIPWADALASSTAFTGMWLMTKKKVESWYWWILTNACSIPLYFVKGLVFTSVYYIVLLAMAFWGLAEWKRKADAIETTNYA